MANSIDISILEEIFYYLSVKDLVKCSRVCKKWHRILNEENSSIWQSKFHETGTTDFRKCPHITNMTYKARVLAYECAWNDDDHSKNIYLMNNCLTLHRNPVAQSTDGARSKAGFCSGQHYFIIIFHGPNLGSAAIVGVSTKKAPLHSNGYCSLLGSDEHGWGWNLSDNTMRHKGEDLATVTECSVSIGQRIGMTLDADQGTLEFDINDRCISERFADLPRDTPLFPTITAVYGNSEISIIYRGRPIIG